jgi:hypothetical protein
MGQNRKSSMRANVFRCLPNNGHRQDISAYPFRANSRSGGENAKVTVNHRKVGGSDPVAPRAQSQRKLGVRFRLLGQAVGEILLFGIAAPVLKRQHGDRRFVGQWKRLGGLD